MKLMNINTRKNIYFIIGIICFIPTLIWLYLSIWGITAPVLEKFAINGIQTIGLLFVVSLMGDLNKLSIKDYYKSMEEEVLNRIQKVLFWVSIVSAVPAMLWVYTLTWTTITYSWWGNLALTSALTFAFTVMLQLVLEAIKVRID